MTDKYKIPFAGVSFRMILLLLSAVVFVMIFSYTTSPIYHEFSDTPDSPIFQLVGKNWAEGAVPYRDFWDMKGPFVFLVNAAGYAMTGSRMGVFLLQIVNLFLTLLGVFTLLRVKFSEPAAFGLTLLSLAGLSYVYDGGNLTEEYLLPLLAWSFYGLLRWIERLEAVGDARHPWPYALLYGAVLGLGLMSRLTNALSVCAAVAVVAVVLLWRREFRNFGANVVAFFAGFALTTLPFFAYFHHHGILSDMWDATFVFPLEYTKNPMKAEYSTPLHYFVLSYLNSMLLMAVAVWLAMRRKKVSTRAVLWFCAAAAPFAWFCLGNGFAHYGMTVYPLFAVAMIEIRAFRWMRLSVAAMLLVGFGSKALFAHRMHHWENEELNNIRAYLRESPAIDPKSFVAYNCTANVYFDMGVRPAVRLFAIQDRGIDFIPMWRDFLRKTFRESHVKWILLSYEDGKQPGIQDVLDEKYTLVYEDSVRHLKTFRAK